MAHPSVASEATDRPILSPRHHVIRKLRRSSSALVGGSIILLFLLAATVGPFLVQYDPLKPNLTQRLKAPGALHWLGTDFLGRDILSRLLYGGRISLLTGVVVVGVALLVGVPIGVIAGYRGGRVDNLMMRAMDVLLAFPGILLTIAVIAVLGPGLLNMMVAVGIYTVPSFARVTRAATLRTKSLLFVDAATALGSHSPRVIWRHILPNVVSPVIVLSSLRIATAILTASSLSFLGLGIQPPSPEWGAMLSDGRNYLRSAPHVATIPGIAIMFVVWGFNLLGDGLRDALDPRSKA